MRRPLIIMIGLYAMAWIFRDSYVGDAAIYWPFFREFWHTPFAFQPGGGAVFGATSPAWVVLGSCIERGPGVEWMTGLRLLGYALIGGAIAAFTRHWLPILLAFASVRLFSYTSAGFESPLVFAYCVAYAWAWREGRPALRGFLAGAGYAVRPELALLLIVEPLCIGPRRYLLAGLSLPIVYHVYMALSGAGFVPAWTVRAEHGEWTHYARYATPYLGLLLPFLDVRIRRRRWVMAAAVPLVLVYALRIGFWRQRDLDVVLFPDIARSLPAAEVAAFEVQIQYAAPHAKISSLDGIVDIPPREPEAVVPFELTQGLYYAHERRKREAVPWYARR